MKIVFYIDSHGFGHATRSLALAAAFPEGTEFLFKTNCPDWLLAEAGFSPAARTPSDLDIHPVHSSGYTVDVPATLAHVRTQVRESPELVDRETQWLLELSPDAVISDVSPLAVAAASQARISSFAVSNFTWAWIFEPYFATKGDLEPIEILRDYQASATLSFRLPFSAPEVFPGKAPETPLLARKVRMAREEARNCFGLYPDLRYHLLTFGGSGHGGREWGMLRDLAPHQFIHVERGHRPAAVPIRRDEAIENLWWVSSENLYHPDLVNAVDGLVTKPGYGILSEAMSTATPMLLAPRRDFREFGPVVQTLEPYPQTRVLDETEFERFDIRESLDSILSVPPQPWQGGLDGAEFIVNRVLQELD
jgi:L-arabinokinase